MTGLWRIINVFLKALKALGIVTKKLLVNGFGRLLEKIASFWTWTPKLLDEWFDILFLMRTAALLITIMVAGPWMACGSELFRNTFLLEVTAEEPTERLLIQLLCLTIATTVSATIAILQCRTIYGNYNTRFFDNKNPHHLLDIPRFDCGKKYETIIHFTSSQCNRGCKYCCSTGCQKACPKCCHPSSELVKCNYQCDDCCLERDCKHQCSSCCSTTPRLGLWPNWLFVLWFGASMSIPLCSACFTISNMVSETKGWIDAGLLWLLLFVLAIIVVASVSGPSMHFLNRWIPEGKPIDFFRQIRQFRNDFWNFFARKHGGVEHTPSKCLEDRAKSMWIPELILGGMTLANWLALKIAASSISHDGLNSIVLYSGFAIVFGFLIAVVVLRVISYIGNSIAPSVYPCRSAFLPWDVQREANPKARQILSWLLVHAERSPWIPTQGFVIRGTIKPNPSNNDSPNWIHLAPGHRALLTAAFGLFVVYGVAWLTSYNTYWIATYESAALFLVLVLSLFSMVGGFLTFVLDRYRIPLSLFILLWMLAVYLPSSGRSHQFTVH